MNVVYCDLCGQPLKEEDYYLLYTEVPITNNVSSVKDYMIKVKNNTKEICPRCKEIFDEIFELRLKNLSQLVVDIKNSYKKPAKLPPYEKPKKKRKLK